MATGAESEVLGALKAVTHWLWAPVSFILGLLHLRLSQLERRLMQSDARLADHRVEVAGQYVTRTEFERALESHIAPIKDALKEIRGDVKALLKDRRHA